MDCLIPFLLKRCKVSTLADQLGNAFGNIHPVHLDFCTTAFFQADTLGAVILAAVHSTGNSMGASADTVFFLEKISKFFCRVVGSCKFIDTVFSAFNTAASGKSLGNLVFRDKSLRLRYLCSGRYICGTVKTEIPERSVDIVQLMIVESEKRPVLFFCRPESCKLVCQRAAKIHVFEPFCKPPGFIRKAASVHAFKHVKISLLYGFFAQIPTEIPQGLCDFRSLMKGSLVYFHICRKTAIREHPGDSLCRLIP